MGHATKTVAMQHLQTVVVVQSWLVVVIVMMRLLLYSGHFVGFKFSLFFAKSFLKEFFFKFLTFFKFYKAENYTKIERNYRT